MSGSSDLRLRPLDPRLARFVQSKMRDLEVPGVAVGIVHGGRAFAGGFGVANVETRVPVDEHTLFQIGSTTKTFTATAVMQLVEKGRLDLDAPLRRYLRGLAPVARRVTLRHLLTHSGGWVGDFFEDTGRGDDALERFAERMRRVRQLTPLGEVWHYNNAGFSLAGRALERIARKPYEALVRGSLLTPLGMEHSCFFADEAITYPVAAGHVHTRRGAQVVRDWALPRSVAPAGGIVSCVADQLRWARFHLGDGRAPDGKRVLRASTLRAMQRKQRDAGAMADAVGIAWLLRRVGDAWTVGHGGTTYGQLSAFTMVPERDFAVTVLTNSTRGGRVHAEVVRWALDRILGMRAPEPTWRTLPRARLAAYEGRYPIGAGYWAADLRARDGGLRVRFVRIKEHAHPDGSSAPVDADWPPAPMMLRFVAPDRAQVPEGPQQRLRVDFLRDPRDRVVWMRWGGRLLRRRPLP